MKKTLLLIFLWSAFGQFVSNAQVYVDKDATGNNDGTSWANAYTSLNDALNNTTTRGTEIWIAEGVYTPTSSTTPFVNQYGLSLYGGFVGNEASKVDRPSDPWTHRVVLSGDLSGDDVNEIPSANSINKSDNAGVILKIDPASGSLSNPYNDVTVKIDRIDFVNAYNGYALYSHPNSNITQSRITLTYCRFKHNYGQTRPAFDIWSNYSAYNTRATTFDLLNCIIDENVSVIGLAYEYRNLSHDQQINVANNLFIANAVESANAYGSLGRFIVTDGTDLLVNFVNNTIALNSEGSSVVPSANISPIKFESVGSTLLKARWYNNIYYSNFRSRDYYSTNNSTQAYVAWSDKNAIDTSPSQNLSGSLGLGASPFFDIDNKDFTPVAAYRTNGNTSGYSQVSILEDCFGNDRVVSNQIGLGAVQYAASNMKTGPGDIATHTFTSSLSVIYVDASASGNNNGASWADAFTSISSALASPQIGQNTKIFVKKGVYKPTSGAYSITQDGLKIYGGFDGTETDENDRDLHNNYNLNENYVFSNNATIIDGDVNGDDVQDIHVNKSDNLSRFFDISADNVTIDGFVMQRAYSANSGNPVINFSGSQINGFSLYNTIIHYNFSDGIFMDFRKFNQAVNFVNVKIYANESSNGMMLLQGSNSNNITANFVNFLFAENRYDSDFGAIWLRRADSATLSTSIINATLAYNTNLKSGNYKQLINLSTNTSNTNVLGIYNSIFWANNYTLPSSTNQLFSDQALGNTKTSEGSAYNIDVDYAIMPANWPNGGVSYNHISNSNPNLDLSYVPTANSTYVINQGSTTYYNTNAYGSLDLAGQTRIMDTAIDLGALEYQSVTAVEDVSLLQFSVYPNPVQSVLFVNIDDVKKIEMYNMSGVKIMTVNQHNQIDVSTLSKGIYLIKVYTGDKVGYKRIIKK
ncbi:MAG TPA: T9SS type A sorting domain-containing protein [Flavobacteriales bacterium]|nr:T9SS type A sorting domain-containing protein [Flavobacteriales bacterium]